MKISTPVERYGKRKWRVQCSWCHATVILVALNTMIHARDLFQHDPSTASKVLCAECAHYLHLMHLIDPDAAGAWRLLYPRDLYTVSHASTPTTATVGGRPHGSGVR
jgi:hypothetical protein